MSSEAVAIRVADLGKCYQIYERPQDRLKQSLIPRLKRKLGLTATDYFKEFWALSAVSFEVRKGETVGIIGRNGSGKSTLLQIICGTLSPTNGTVETRGRVAALLELGSGFNPEFTGRENIYLNASVLGLNSEQIDARYDAIAAFADIGDFIDQPTKTYSSGMIVRLAFAVIAHVDADVLIIDEALAVGDAVFVQKCNRFIRNFLSQGTLLFVSHSMQSVVDLCNRAIWLMDGELREDGDAKNVVMNYNAYVHQQINTDKAVSVTIPAARDKPARPNAIKDIRQPLFANSDRQFRLQIFTFDWDSPYWGVGGAEITDAALIDAHGARRTVVDDCGNVLLRISCRARTNLEYPIVGFSIRNHRGVDLISDNSSMAHSHTPPPRIPSGATFHADFAFFLPYLPPGEYTLGAAIADGIPGAHVQHQRRDDALKFTVLSSHVVYGLFAMPLEHCELTLDP